MLFETNFQSIKLNFKDLFTDNTIYNNIKYLINNNIDELLFLNSEKNKQNQNIEIANVKMEKLLLKEKNFKDEDEEENEEQTNKQHGKIINNNNYLNKKIKKMINLNLKMLK